MLPDGTEWLVTILQFKSSFLCSCFKCLVHFGLAAGSRIDILQLKNGKWSLLRILALKGLIEIWQFWFAVTQLLDDQTHLQPPVTQMHIADHVITQETAHSLDALTDDRRTEMSYMKRFCHIGSAVVHDDGLTSLHFFHAKLVLSLHAIHIRSEILAI